MNEDFWKNLPHFDDFDQSLRCDHYTAFDDTWYLFIADIQGSTQAIQKGKYKDVNLIGALCIISVLNACKGIEIPFVFGGDGASLLVPSSYISKAKDALLATKLRSLEHFNMTLRVGAIGVKELYEKGISLNVAKHRVSKDFYQALFQGGGMAQADTLIKQDPTYCFNMPEHPLEADFTGLECRWQDVFSQKDETISLLIYAQDNETYQEALHFINAHLGTYEHRQPVQTSALKLSFSLPQLLHEAKAKEKGLKRISFLCKIFFINILGAILMRFNIRTEHIQWGEYKKQITLTTDCEKFDDMLRMICAVKKEDRIALENYLQTAHQNKKLCYGMHVSNRALMTCLVFDRMGPQVHFVDAADGGYAMAAVGLKQQLKNLNA